MILVKDRQLAEECKMRVGGKDPESGETGVASKGNQTELFRSQTDRGLFRMCEDEFQHEEQVMSCTESERVTGLVVMYEGQSLR